MEFSNEEQKVPTGVKVIAIIEFIFKGFAIILSLFSMAFIGSASSMLSKAELDQVNSAMPSTGVLVACLIAYIVIIIGAIMLLKKNKVGLYLYIVAYIVQFVLGIVSTGFSPFSIVGLVLPVLMVVFVMKDKELFGL